MKSTRLPTLEESFMPYEVVEDRTEDYSERTCHRVSACVLG